MLLVPTKWESLCLVPFIKRGLAASWNLPAPAQRPPENPKKMRSPTKRRCPCGFSPGQPLLLFHICGVGPHVAARSVAGILNPPRARRWLLIGFCGALDPSLRPGDLIVAQEVVAWEGLQPKPPPTGIGTASCPLLLPHRNERRSRSSRGADQGAILEAPKGLMAVRTATHDSLLWERTIRACLRAGLVYRTGRLLTTSRPVLDPHHRQHWKEITGACAVAMEDFPLAQLTQAAQVSFLSVRAVSDPVGWEVPEELSSLLFCGEAGAGLGREILRRPSLFPPVAKLSMGAATALWRLQRFIAAFLRE